ncbi:MAG TPA: hypothetical protein VG474_09960, partial [Solirubrobacteraceae bacterium]|nr:hypothetical protein [Solirubrobacteraceae bacterium]
SWAPELSNAAYRKIGPLYWRVATVDEGNNVGAFTTARISAGRTMTVRLRGSLRRNATSRITVFVRGANRRALRGATVSVRGAGVRAHSKRTSRRGTATFRLRPTAKGSVTFTVRRSSYGDETKTLRVR